MSWLVFHWFYYHVPLSSFNIPSVEPLQQNQRTISVLFGLKEDEKAGKLIIQSALKMDSLMFAYFPSLVTCLHGYYNTCSAKPRNSLTIPFKAITDPSPVSVCLSKPAALNGKLDSSLRPKIHFTTCTVHPQLNSTSWE